MAQVIATHAAQGLTTVAQEDILSPPFQVLECRVYRGPHLYSQTPMIRIQADLGLLEEWPTSRLPGFAGKLLAALPGLGEHGCGSGRPHGFAERLEEGTWMGHVIEHVAIELQNMAGIDVTRGKTRSVKGRPGHYDIMYAYRFEEAGRCAGRLAIELVGSLLEPPFDRFRGLDEVCALSFENGFDLQEGIAVLKRLVAGEKLGPTTQALVEEAERRRIPWQRLDDASLVQLGTGKYRKLIRASITSQTPFLAVETAGDKELTKQMLHGVSIPVPMGEVVQSLEGALEVAEELGFPLVVKPLDGNHGRGVTTELQKMEEVASAFQRAREHSTHVIVERYFAGRDYRVLVVNGEVAAVAERVPAHVIGNGRDSIRQLIEKVNADPRRGDGHENVMTRIAVDETLMAWIARAGMTLDCVPARKRRVVLAATANLSTGGTSVDHTDAIHPDNAAIARRAAQTIGLDVAGIDFIIPDIARSWKEVGGGIVEVNASPGLRMHLAPSVGKPRDVARPIVSSLFPAQARTQVPVVTVTGTNGKSTTVRMITHILRQAGQRVGVTSTSGVYVNDDCIWQGDASGPRSARLLMRDPSIDVAVLETARGGILREGLGVMESDVGAVLNVTSDHLGIGGIDTLEDLAAVKSVVAESVRRGGVSVLNADDPLTRDMADIAGGEICYFSMLPADGCAVREHFARGGFGVTRESVGGRAHLMLHRDGTRTPLIAVDDVPATFHGAARFNVENALAAAAIAAGIGADPQHIRAGLASFGTSYEQNPGRFNIHDGHGFRVVMDYAHNPAAMTAFYDLIRQMRGGYGRVIGNASTPGDRRDEDIVEVGRIAGSELDLAVFQEEPDRRGRPQGEILRLLAEGARAAGCRDEDIACVTTEEEAIDLCLKQARPGDLVILMPSDIEACWKRMLAFKPSFAPQQRRPDAVQEEERRAYA